jgi:hypothetical protein
MPATLSARLPDYAGTLDEHMHLLLPALIRLFKVDTSVDIRRAAIKTLTRLIPRVQVGYRACFYLLSSFKLDLFRLTNMIFLLFLFDIYGSSLILGPFPFCHQVTGHISSLVHHLKLVLDG